MNKKVIALIVTIIVVLSGIIIAYFCFFNNQDGNNSTLNSDKISAEEVTTESWLRASSLSELEKIGKITKKDIELDYEDAYVSELPFGEGTATYSYKINSEEEIVGLNIGKVLVSSSEKDNGFVMEEVTVSQLRERVDAVLGWVSEVLNVDIGTDYYITTDNFDMLSVEEDASYQQILDGTAVLDLRILDNDESVWILEIGKVQGYNIISCTFEHCMADSEEAQLPCYVAVE